MIYVKFLIGDYHFYIKLKNKKNLKKIYDYIILESIKKLLEGSKIEDYKSFINDELKLDTKDVLCYNINTNILYIKDNSIYIGLSEIDLDHLYRLKVVLENITQDVKIVSHCILIDKFLYYSMTSPIQIDILNKLYIFQSKLYKNVSELYNLIKDYISKNDRFMFLEVISENFYEELGG